MSICVRASAFAAAALVMGSAGLAHAGAVND